MKKSTQSLQKELLEYASKLRIEGWRDIEFEGSSVTSMAEDITINELGKLKRAIAAKITKIVKNHYDKEN